MVSAEEREKNFATYPIIIRDLQLLVTKGSIMAHRAGVPMLPKPLTKY